MKWISVKTRLPKSIHTCLIVVDGYCVKTGYYMHSLGRWNWEQGEYRVSHWMPLPKPPKVKEKAAPKPSSSRGKK